MGIAEIAGVICGSSVLATLIGKVFDYISDRRKRKDTVEDKEAEKDSELVTLVKSIDAKLDAHIKADDERNAVNCRIRILRFADEMYLGQLHSREHFQQCLEDCRIYDEYCKKFPSFKNQITATSVRLINDQYAECTKNKTFLDDLTQKKESEV